MGDAASQGWTGIMGVVRGVDGVDDVGVVDACS
jgi:hypothetical protein